MKSPDSDQGKADAAQSGQHLEPVPPAAPDKLTPEEQMDLYEKELKENDWGHQPC